MASQSIIRPSSLATKAVAIAIAVAAAAPFAANSAGLGPQSYVQSGLVTQFDAIDNENTGTHNPAANVWRDLKGSAYITLQGSAGWSDRYFDSTYETKQMISGWPQYVRDSLTIEAAMRIVKPSSSSSSLIRFLGRASTDCYYLQNGHIYFYYGFEGADKRPHSGDHNYMGTFTGYSGSNGYGLAFDGTVKAKFDQRAALSWYATDDGTGWFTGSYYLNGENANSLQGHYYAIRFYNRSLSPAEIATNAVIDKLRFFSFKYVYGGVEEHWADIEWEAPEATAASPPTAPGNTTNDYVQIIGARVTVDAGDNIGLMGLSLEDGATLSIPSGSRAAVKVLYVNGQPVPRGLYSGDGQGGVRVAWLAGSGVLAVAGATDGTFPTGTYKAPDANGYYVFGRTSANGGATGFGTGWTPQPNNQFLWLSAECPEWGDYWFPAGAKLKLVGYVLLKTIPAGIFGEIDLSEAEHIVMYNKTATADGSPLVLPAGVELRYQPAGYWNYRSDSDKWWMPTARGSDAEEEGPLVINGKLRVYGNGTHLASQQFNGAISGTGIIQLGDFNNAARFSGTFTFTGTAAGFNNATLLWVDSLNVNASLGDVTLNGGGNYGTDARYNANGIFFGKDASGEMANGVLNIGNLRGEARSLESGGTRWRTGGALAVWGGNTIHVDTLKSSLHVVGRPQDLGCTWSWFGTAAAVGNGNLFVDDADFIGNMFLSTNVNVMVGDVSNAVTFDYTYHSDAVNATTLDITNSCNVGASVQATDLAMLPSRLSGFKGSVTLTDTATKSYGVQMDFMHGTNSLYNIGGCIGSGTLAAAPANGTINVTFNIPHGQEPVEGRYAVASFSSGGDLLRGWAVTLNDSPAPFARIGNYYVSVRRDSTTGIWLKVTKIRGTMFVVQ